MSRPVVCSIGTTDPWNAAGLGRDIRTIAECGGRSVMVVAAVSAQDEAGLQGLVALSPDMIRAQWEALAEARIAAVRIGALYGAPAVQTIAAFLRGIDVPVVYDPVLRTSRGGAFADEDTVASIVLDLLPTATVCTPNLAEAAELSGLHVTSVEEMEAAAGALLARGPKAVLITGGHLAGDPVDVLADALGVVRFEGARIATDLRGTGCILSGALAAELARGVPFHAAVERARAFVRMKIAGAVRTGDFYLAE